MSETPAGTLHSFNELFPWSKKKNADLFEIQSIFKNVGIQSLNLFVLFYIAINHISATGYGNF